MLRTTILCGGGGAGWRGEMRRASGELAITTRRAIEDGSTTSLTRIRIILQRRRAELACTGSREAAAGRNDVAVCLLLLIWCLRPMIQRDAVAY